MSIRILVADDHKIFRDGLRNLLEQQEDMKVVGEVDNGRAAVEMACTLAPNVAILDIGMPELNGIDATKKLLADAPNVKVIALSMHSDRRFVEGMLQAG
ncbi:MAG: response regulator transcription factor, partial [Pirellulaceae bacterium]|nr:response regulator transcription factor [Pirellulaceae bacterium]